MIWRREGWRGIGFRALTPLLRIPTETRRDDIEMTMSDNLQSISDSLYSDKPNSRLFHYTSIDGLMGIVEKRALWASEVRYLNDAHELHHFGSLIDQQIVPGQVLKSDSEDRQILGQFRKWLKERLSFGPLIFVSSLTEKGNLLSQWRGYCPHGQGVSLGFNPDL